MIDFLRKFLFEKNKPQILVKRKEIIAVNNVIKKKNYIIKRNRWHGMFSNLHYVIKHIIYANKKKLLIYVDMENFPTIYNESKKINKTYNAWGYYFTKYFKKNLNLVYKKKNFVFSDENNLDTSKIKKTEYKEYKNILTKDLINKSIFKKALNFKKKYFKNKKILGVHLRGSDQKSGALHPFPPTLNQTISITEKMFKKYQFDAIFLVTEEKNYFNKFKKKFGKKLIKSNAYRSDDDIFFQYPRKKHRYLLGYETIINMILLSKVNHLIHSNTNFSAMSVIYSKKKLYQTIIFNGYNSKNIFLASILWYLKSLLPYNFGGFENKIKQTSKLEAL